jgi:peptidoglycan/xylan/chitin deacetylase (PgdA/CDA1 family)
VGHVTLTLDDGLACQIEHALPVLNELKVRATFFLPVIPKDLAYDPPKMFDTRFRSEVWREAISQGHDVGSHAVHHESREAMEKWDAYRAYLEAIRAIEFLEAELGNKVVSHAYPKGFYTPSIQAAVKKFTKQARGVEHSEGVEKGKFDRYDIPTICMGRWNTRLLPDVLNVVAQTDKWLNLTFHGIGPDDTQVHNMPTEDFRWLLREIKGRGVPIVTFAEGAELYAG